MSAFPEKSVTMMYGSMLCSVARGWVGVKYPGKNHYLTLERPPIYYSPFLKIANSAHAFDLLNVNVSAT